MARTVDLLGDWWTPLVIREAFLGATRFEEFQHALSIGRNVLTQRLGRLVAEGLFERRQYQTRPPRYEYLLTEKGTDFFDVMLALLRWGDRWMDRGDGPPLLLRHTPCGHVGPAQGACSKCRKPLRWGGVEIVPGPGLTPQLAAGFAERAAVRAARRSPRDAERTPGDPQELFAREPKQRGIARVSRK